MTDLAALNTANTWTDLSGFGALRHTAQTDAKSALPIVAKQFESIFTQMMLKSMREASPKDELTESSGGDQWRDMFDQQLSVSLTQHGKGIGIAEMLIRQLGGHDASASLDGSGGVGNPDAGGFSGQGGKNDDWKDRLVALADATRKAGKSVAKWIPADIGEFVRDLAPHAVEAAKRLGVSLRVVLAQAALETQYGKHMPQNRDGTTSYNLFGIKAGASWDGAKVSVPTLEYENGVAVRRQANFRAYDSPSHSFSDFADLIGNSARYAGAIGKGDDALGFGRALVQGGYATDPAYASKIAQIANSPAMRNALEALKNSLGLPNQ
jgi:flagellar protein FlgJ